MYFWILAIAAVLVVWFGIAVHEIGHALACRRAGIPVREISLLGFPLPGIKGWQLPFKSRTFPETIFLIHPVLLGAYMKPDNVAMEAAGRRERVRILAMGPIASLLFGLTLLTLCSLAFAADTIVGGCTKCLQKGAVNNQPWTIGMFVAIGCATLSVTILILLLRRYFWFHIALLVVGIALLPLMAYVIYTLLVDVLFSTKPLHEILTGMFGTVRVSRDWILAMHDDQSPTLMRGIGSVAIVAGGLSLFIGLANLVPMFAGDGTMIIMEYVPERLGKLIWTVTLAVMGLFMLLVLVGDAADILHFVRG